MPVIVEFSQWHLGHQDIKEECTSQVQEQANRNPEQVIIIDYVWIIGFGMLVQEKEYVNKYQYGFDANRYGIQYQMWVKPDRVEYKENKQKGNKSCGQPYQPSFFRFVSWKKKDTCKNKIFKRCEQVLQNQHGWIRPFVLQVIEQTQVGKHYYPIDTQQKR